MRVAAIILAGGSGKRMGGDLKQFMKINNKSVLSYSIDAFLTVNFISEIIVAVPKHKLNYSKKTFGEQYIDKRLTFISGGRTRPLSSLEALKYLKSKKKKSDYVIFHDAARPLVTAQMIKEVYNGGRKFGAATVGVNAIDTLGEVEGGFMLSSPDRDSMYYVYLPQCYKFDLIWEAYRLAMKQKNKDLLNSADNSVLLLNYGKKIKAIKSCYPNFKLTYPEDIKIIETFLKNR